MSITRRELFAGMVAVLLAPLAAKLPKPPLETYTVSWYEKRGTGAWTRRTAMRLSDCVPTQTECNRLMRKMVDARARGRAT